MSVSQDPCRQCDHPVRIVEVVRRGRTIAKRRCTNTACDTNIASKKRFSGPRV